MNFLDILENLESILKKENELDYYIINNIYGKNLILLESDRYSRDKLLEIKVKLENKFKNAIQDVIFEDNRLASEIKNICQKNSVTHRNISYSAWNKDKINPNKNKIVKKVIAGYSFKGGMGRSITIAYLSHYFYSLGKKIVILDCDFEAPGISTLFFNKGKRKHKAGILDYLIDCNINDNLPLDDYFLELEASKKGGNIYLFPSGIDYKTSSYLNKISKIDFNSLSYIKKMYDLIENIKNHPILKPDIIFIDLRAGISESNGNFLSKISDLNLLFFNSEEQNEEGLEIILNNINIESSILLNSGIRFNDKELRDKKQSKLKHFINSLKIKGENNLKVIEIPFNQKMLESNISDVEDGFINDLKMIIKNKYFEINSKPINSEVNLKEIFKKLEKEFRKIIGKEKFLTENDLKYFYFKDDIQLLINEQKFLILGPKGSGKSTLFEIFKQNFKPILNKLNVHKNSYLVGFSNDNINDISSEQIININGKAGKKNKNINIKRFWKYLTLFQLENKLNIQTPVFKNINDIASKITNNEISILVDESLRDLNIDLLKKENVYTFLYDELDVNIPEDLRIHFISNLISFWQENIYKYTQIRAKIFLRNDIFELLKIENKTHLDINKFELIWSKKEILSLILKIIIATLSEKEIKNLGLDLIVKSYVNYEIISDDEKVNLAIRKLFAKRISSKGLFMDDWIIKYLSDSNNVITPRTIYKFLSEIISNEMEKLSEKDSSRDIIFFNFIKNYKIIHKKVSLYRLEEYINEYPKNNKYINKIKSLGYANFIFEDFKKEYTEKNKADKTIQKYLQDLQKTGFLKYEKQTKKYRLAEIYTPALNLKKNKRGK